MEYLLSTDRLTKIFKNQKAVDNITLHIREAAEKVDTTAYIWYNVIIKYRRWHYG